MEKRIRNYIESWEQRCYTYGIPDEAPIEISDMVPSYRKVAIAILKNDYSLKSLGFTAPVSKYYNEIKKEEIKNRVKIIIMAKITDFTEGQIELLKLLCNGYNICLYREGLVRMRDAKHNPVRNVRSDMFEKVRSYLVKKDGLYIFDEAQRATMPEAILRG